MNQRIVCFVLGILALGTASVASARVDFSVNIGPPPVVYAPDPYYVAPPVVYIGGGYWGDDHWGGDHEHHERGHHHHGHH
jgi:hypothetical protein